MIIGLTGGIATGKSTVANILKSLGSYVIDADKISHEILDKSKEAYKAVVEEFGKNILDENEKIDRKKLGKEVFSENKKLQKLENITHPFILREIKKKIEKNKNEHKHLVLDAPLLFETNLDEVVDCTILIVCDYSIQIKRIKNRDGLSVEEAKKRIDAQMPLSEKKKLADEIISNNGSREELIYKVLRKWKKLNLNNLY
ncbi:MAG: dephospho-CoA kinase [Bacillota bacterium]